MCAEQLSVHTGGECHGKGEGEGDADADADAAAAVDAAADNDDDDGSDQGMSPAAFALALRAQLPCASQRAPRSAASRRCRTHGSAWWRWRLRAARWCSSTPWP